MTAEQQQLNRDLDGISATQSFLLAEMEKVRRMPAGDGRERVWRELGARAGQVWRELVRVMARHGIAMALVAIAVVGCAGKNGESHPSFGDLKLLFSTEGPGGRPLGKSALVMPPMPPMPGALGKSAGGPAHSIMETQTVVSAGKDLQVGDVAFLYPTNAAEFPWWDVQVSTNLVAWSAVEPFRNMHWPPDSIPRGSFTATNLWQMRFYRMRGHLVFEP